MGSSQPRPPIVGIPRYVPQSGHSGEISALAWNRDGTLLATSSKEDGVKLWAMPDGAAVAELHTRNTDPSDLAFSPDGHSLAVANWSGALELWDLGELRPRAMHRDHEGAVQSLAYTPDGGLLLSGGQDGTIYVYETRAQKLRGRITAMPAAVYAMAFSPDGKRLACSAGSKVQIRETGTWQPLRALEAHTKPVTSLAWSPDGRSIATGGEDGLVILWDAEKGLASKKIPASLSVQDLAWNGSGDSIAAGLGDGLMRVWNADNGEKLRDWKCERCSPGASSLVSFNAGATSVAVGNRNVVARDVASGSYIFEVETGPPRFVGWQPGADRLLVEAPVNRLNQVEIDGLATSMAGWWTKDVNLSWNRDGRRLALCSPAGTVRVIDTREGGTIASYNEEGFGLPALALSPDGKTVAYPDTSQRMRLWRVGSASSVRIGDSRAGAWAWSPDSSTLALAEGKTLRLLNAATHKEIAHFPADAEMLAISFRPDGKQIAASERETGRLRIWETATRREVSVLEGPAGALALDYSPDGRWLAAAGPGSGVRIWNAQTGKLQQSIEQGSSRLSWHRGSKVLSIGGSPALLLRVEDGENLWAEVGGQPAQTLVFAVDGLHDGVPSASSNARFRIGKGAIDFAMLSASQLPDTYKHPGLLRDFVEGRPLPHPQAGVAAQPH